MRLMIETLAAYAVLSGILPALAAGNQADKAKPLDPQKSAKYIEFQGGLIMAPDNGNRIVVWDATGKASAAVDAFTNTATRLLSLPFSVKTDPVTGPAYKAAKSVKSNKTPSVIVINVAGDDVPALSVFPEEAISCINYSALADENEETTKTRIEKELFRSLGFALGGYAVSRTACVMDIVYSRDELDTNTTMLLSPLRKVGISKAAEKLKIPLLRKTLYSTAVRQGWAPAPTNDVQRKIWDDVYSIPQKPMKIQFDPASQKGTVTK